MKICKIANNTYSDKGDGDDNDDNGDDDDDNDDDGDDDRCMTVVGWDDLSGSPH